MAHSIPARSVHFVISGDILTAEAISAHLGMLPDRQERTGDISHDTGLKHPRPALEHRWELRAAGGGDAPVPDLLNPIISRIGPVAAKIKELTSRGCLVRLSVVLYLSSADAAGPGLDLTREQLAVLSSCGADFEVDQYL